MFNSKQFVAVFAFILTAVSLGGCRNNSNISEGDLIIDNQVKGTKFTFLSPQPAETWKKGESLFIQYNIHPELKYINIELYRKTSLWTTIVKNQAFSESFLWRIPDTLKSSVHYKIKISSSQNPNECGWSDPFSVSN